MGCGSQPRHTAREMVSVSSQAPFLRAGRGSFRLARKPFLALNPPKKARGASPAFFEEARSPYKSSLPGP